MKAREEKRRVCEEKRREAGTDIKEYKQLRVWEVKMYNTDYVGP